MKVQHTHGSDNEEFVTPNQSPSKNVAKTSLPPLNQSDISPFGQQVQDQRCRMEKSANQVKVAAFLANEKVSQFENRDDHQNISQNNHSLDETLVSNESVEKMPNIAMATHSDIQKHIFMN